MSFLNKAEVMAKWLRSASDSPRGLFRCAGILACVGVGLVVPSLMLAVVLNAFDPIFGNEPTPIAVYALRWIFVVPVFLLSLLCFATAASAAAFASAWYLARGSLD